MTQDLSYSNEPASTDDLSVNLPFLNYDILAYRRDYTDPKTGMLTVEYVMAEGEPDATIVSVQRTPSKTGGLRLSSQIRTLQRVVDTSRGIDSTAPATFTVSLNLPAIPVDATSTLRLCGAAYGLLIPYASGNSANTVLTRMLRGLEQRWS